MISPIDGMVTNLPVRVGETVVPGVQNSAVQHIMTVADMSLITAEVKVDETDIVNVNLGQPAEVTIDAIPNQTFKGHVTEIGNTAILRSTGLAASQSTTSNQEAKDFKVVIAIDNPPDDIRPGLSCTGKITTATQPARAHHSDSGSDGPAARRSGADRARMKAFKLPPSSIPRPRKPRRKSCRASLWSRTGERSFRKWSRALPAPPTSKF